jgi:hypothetical protein
MSDTKHFERDRILGTVLNNGWKITAWRYAKAPKHQTVLTVEGDGHSVEYRFSFITSNVYILEVLNYVAKPVPKERAFILGNGPSLNDLDFNKLKGETTYAVNRIWKMFDKTDWRPTHYVRGEVAIKRQDVFEDFIEMAKYPGIQWHMMAGLQRIKQQWHPEGTEYFAACEGSGHPWHLPMICAYGTVVHIAMQIAVRDGAKSIYLLGCDLGDKHFYPDAAFSNDDAYAAHILANGSCPVPIYNASSVGELDVYERRPL